MEMCDSHIGAWGVRLTSLTNVKCADNKVQTPVARLDTFMKTYSIPMFELIQMDVEGAEHVVLAHRATMAAVAQSDIFVIEVHDWIAQGSTKVVNNLFEVFPGFTQFWYDENMLFVNNKHLQE